MEPLKSERTEQLRLQNSGSVDVTFYLEPWGEQFTMSRGTTFEIVACGPEGDCLEIVVGDNRITVYGWSGSIISVYHDGNLLGGSSVPAPSTPTRTTVDGSD